MNESRNLKRFFLLLYFNIYFISLFSEISEWDSFLWIYHWTPHIITFILLIFYSVQQKRKFFFFFRGFFFEFLICLLVIGGAVVMLAFPLNPPRKMEVVLVIHTHNVLSYILKCILEKALIVTINNVKGGQMGFFRKIMMKLFFKYNVIHMTSQHIRHHHHTMELLL